VSNTLSTLAAIVREMYPPDAIGNALLVGCPLYAEMEKDWNAAGEPIRMATKYASGGGHSSLFSDALATIGSIALAKWLLTTVDSYKLFSIAGKAIKATKGNRGALVDVLQEAGNTSLEHLCSDVHAAVYRDHGGSRGVIASGSGSTTITLTNVEDVLFWQVGDVVASDNTDGTGAGAADDGEYITITAVDEDLGRITKAGGNWNANGNFAAGDNLFHRGNIGLGLSGLASWLPASPPGATAFFGVARNVDPVKLGGIRFVAVLATHQTIEGALVAAAARALRGKARPTHCFLHPYEFGVLVRELGDRVRYEKVVPSGTKGMKVQGHVGFDAVVLSVGSGTIKVLADPYCQRFTGWMLQMDTWKLVGYQEPGWLTHDGMEILREASADGVQGRMGTYYQLGCKAPGCNVRIDLTTVVPS
jgi:hypothetical protein